MEIRANRAEKQVVLSAKFRLVKPIRANAKVMRNGDQRSEPEQLPLPYQYSLNNEDYWSELLNEYYRGCHSCDYLK